MNKHLENLRVLHMTTIDFTIKKMLIDKMKELEPYGYSIDFMSDDTGLVEDIEKSGFRHITVEMSRKIDLIQDLKSIMAVYKILKRESYDIVHTHTAKAGMIGRIAARLAGTKIVVHTSHGLPFYEGQSALKNFIYKKLEQLASWFSDGYFSQNYEDLSIVQKMVGGRVLTGYEGNGVNLKAIDQSFKLTDNEKKEIRREIGLLENEFIFLMAARFEPVKNHHMLLKALKEIKVNHYPFKALLAGNGPLMEETKAMAQELGIENNIIFLGYRDDIINLLQISDAVVLTSEKEGIPRILMEAMALSKPVLATKVLGTKELVSHQETGELVELNSPVRLAQRMGQWIDPAYKETLLSYGRNGRGRVKSEFTEAKVAERIDQFYKELIRRKMDITEQYHEVGNYEKSV